MIISLYAQVQFHAKYPLIDSQSEREFAFSYAILLDIQVLAGEYSVMWHV